MKPLDSLMAKPAGSVERPDPDASPSRHARFRLNSLLLAPLLVSPLCFSAMTVSDRLTGGIGSRDDPFNQFVHLLACAAGYVLVFVLVFCRRSSIDGRNAARQRQTFYQILLVGGLFGAAFGLQMAMPEVCADAFRYIRQQSLAVTIRRPFRWINLGIVLLYSPFFFSLIGLAVGGVYAMALGVRFPNRRSQTGRHTDSGPRATTAASARPRRRSCR